MQKRENKPRICADWFQNRSGKEKEDIEYLLRNNSVLIEAFLEILTRYEQQEIRSEISTSQYDNPSWAYKQADTNGARRAFAKVRALFSTMETNH